MLKPYHGQQHNNGNYHPKNVGHKAENKPSPSKVAETVATGHIIRVKQKSVTRKSAHRPPRPARARRSKVVDVRMSKRRILACERCLRRHGVVLTHRLETLALPLRRRIIYLWREYHHRLPSHMIHRISKILGANIPYDPAQACDLFKSIRKSKKKTKRKSIHGTRVCNNRYVWARNATVNLARGIQQRLIRPGVYTMEDRMLRLSNIILQEICRNMRSKTPSRSCKHRKAKFMIEMADKVAVWIDEILTESDTVMLMMDCDEDDEVTGMYDSFADGFLDMMAGGVKGETDRQRMARLEAEKILGRPETEDERKRRLKMEKLLGRPETPEELRARIEAEKKLGRPETAEEIKKRIAEQDLKKYGPETDAQKKARLESEKILGRPETESERKERLEIEKRLGRPETPEELRARLEAAKKGGAGQTDQQRMARLEAEKILGRPETEEERKRRLEMENLLGRPETPEELRARIEAEKKLGRPETAEEIKKRIAEQDLKKYGPETDAQKKARLQSEKILGRPETESERKERLEIEKRLGRPETPEELRARLEAAKKGGAGETDQQRMARLEAEKILGRPEYEEERKRRLEIEKLLGRPETPEELRARTEAEKKLGRPETVEEIKKRMAEQDLKKYAAETDAQKKARLESEKILGRPETESERKERLAIEKRLGRPETPEELRARLEAAKKGGAGETDQQRMARLEAEKILGRPETEEERKRRLEMEKMLGRPETPEELRARIEAEKKLGRPETAEEIKKRIAEQDLKKETDAQKQARLESEKILGRPETESERKERLEIEKRLGRPETPEELRARLEAAKKGSAGENDQQRMARLEAEKILGRPETEEERKRRLEMEKLLGRPETPEELRARIEVEKKLGRPETAEEIKNRIAEQDLKKYGPETDAQKKARLESEKILGRPETESERKERLEIEKRLGRPETPEELRARLEAAKKGGAGETDQQRMARLEAEKILGRPETEEERKRRLEMEKLLGRPETPEELRARIEVEKKLGRPETAEEIKKRIAEQDLKKYGPETDAQKKARLQSEKILGRPETESERKERLEIEKRLGRPETPEELRARLEAAKKGGAGETDQQRMARLEAEKILGRPETEDERKRRLEIEKLLGRPETPEELRARTEAEKKLGRPETAEEIKKRMAEQNLQKHGAETDAQKQARLEAEKVLGRPETEAERKRRLEVERQLGRPETQQEMRGRLEAEKRLGRPETPAEYEARVAAEKMLGRPETDAEYKARLEVEKRLGRPETEEEYRKRMGSQIGSGKHEGREAAMNLLHKELKAKGQEILYEKPKTKLTHSEASEWLTKPPFGVDKHVMESSDTKKTTQKLEKKLSALLSNAPKSMKNVLEDVITESARKISEFFVTKNHRALAADSLIAELQKRGSMTLIEADGVAETTFFAAQRLKMAKSLQVKEPRVNLSNNLQENLNDIVKGCTMSRKLTEAMKDHVRRAADYLSVHVTKPEPKIEAYVALLREMEAAGDRLLIEGEIKKSFKDSASYLRQLTTFEDEINRPNPDMQAKTIKKLEDLMSKVQARGYGDSDMNSVIADSAKLLTSYTMLQVKKTEALKNLIGEMDKHGDTVLLRHGTVRKTCTEGADTLRGKTVDQLYASGADSVTARKIQIKLNQIMAGTTPSEFQDVIEDAVTHLAVALLLPHSVKVCKCINSVYVQCELWCEEMLRQLPRPCCKCSRQVSTRDLASLLPPDTRLRVDPDNLHVSAVGANEGIELSQCPATERGGSAGPCPADRPCSAPAPPPERPSRPDHPPHNTTSYMVHTITRNRDSTSSGSSDVTVKQSMGIMGFSTNDWPHCASQTWSTDSTETLQPKIESSNESLYTRNPAAVCTFIEGVAGSSGSNFCSQEQSREFGSVLSSMPTMTSIETTFESTSDSPVVTHRARDRCPKSMSSIDKDSTNTQENYQTMVKLPIERQSRRQDYSDSKQGIPNSKDQMFDWSSMMISFIWNVRGWFTWMQAIIDRALSSTSFNLDHDWVTFQRKVITEATQYRQCNIFLRQLKLQLALRYRDKRIVSPIRGTDKTEQYLKYLRDTLETIDMFSRWTKWLISTMKEMDGIKPVEKSNISQSQLRWHCFKAKVQEIKEDWAENRRQLERFWNYKLNPFLSEVQKSGPTWVVSANGAVPSGAVAAGLHHGELVWLARTMHRSKVVPAALVPSKQCCLVYDDGAVHNYSKYQVLCNANVDWVPWRAAPVMLSRAVRVAAEVYVGRVRFRGSHLVGAVRAPEHRCHIIVMGRPFAFHSFELLMYAGDDKTVTSFNTE